MSKYPFMTVFHSCLLMSALGVIGILRTASCPVFRCYQMLTEPLSPVPESVPESVPASVPVSPPPGVVPPPLGVVLPPPGVVPPPLGVVLPPPGVVSPVVLSSAGFLELLLFTVSTRLMVVSRFEVFSSPVALARRRRPSMYFATVQSSFLSEPPFTFRPREKMARSGNFTFLPKRRSSLVQLTASVNMPRIAPLL